MQPFTDIGQEEVRGYCRSRVDMHAGLESGRSGRHAVHASSHWCMCLVVVLSLVRWVGGFDQASSMFGAVAETNDATASHAKVMRVFHVSGNGGTTLCHMARYHTRVKLPQPEHNCNPLGAGPIWNSYSLRPPQGRGWRKCGWNPAEAALRMRRTSSSTQGSKIARLPSVAGVFFMESGLDAEFPCDDTVDVLLVREPWSRALSRTNAALAKLWQCSNQKGGLDFPKLRRFWLEAFDRSEPSRKNGSTVTVDAAWGQGHFRSCVRAVDNFYIR
jgi:hypothetical protein